MSTENSCKTCKISMRCLPLGVGRTFAALLRERLTEKGTQLRFSRFELMAQNLTHSSDIITEPIAEAYKHVASLFVCGNVPHIRVVLTSVGGDFHEVKIEYTIKCSPTMGFWHPAASYKLALYQQRPYV